MGQTQSDHAADDSVKRVVEGLRTHRDELLAYLRSRTTLDADDLFQEVSLRAVTGADLLTGSEPGQLRAWLFTILRRSMADMGRLQQRERRKRDAVEHLDRPQAPAPLHQTPDDLCSCVVPLIRELPDDQAQLLQRAILDDEQTDRLAEEFGLTRNALWVRLHRARKALRTIVETRCGITSYDGLLGCECGPGSQPGAESA